MTISLLSLIMFAMLKPIKFLLDQEGVQQPEVLVSYVLGITNIDPLEYDLLF